MNTQTIWLALLLPASMSCGDAPRDHSYQGEPAATLTVQTPELPKDIGIGLEFFFNAHLEFVAPPETGVGYVSIAQSTSQVDFAPSQEPDFAGKSTLRIPLHDHDFLSQYSFIAHVVVSAGFDVRLGNALPHSYVPAAHTLTLSPRPAIRYPFGPAGPEVQHPGGAALYERVCKSDHMDLLPVPFSTVVPLVEAPLEIPAQARDEDDQLHTELMALKRCGLSVPADQVGVKIADRGAASLMWHPDSTSLLLLSRPLISGLESHSSASPSETLLRFVLATGTMEQAATGAFLGPLQVAPSGLVYVGYQTSAGTSSDEGSRMFEATITPGAAASLRSLPVPGTAALSPNGLFLAAETSRGRGDPRTTIFAVAGGEVAMARGVVPVAWLPGAETLLVSTALRDGFGVPITDTMLPLSTLDLSSNLTPLGLSIDPATGHAPVGILAGGLSGPELLTTATDIGLWSMPLAAPQAAQPIFTRLQGRLLPKLATRSASGPLFIWGRKCLGLRESHCYHELHMLSGPMKADKVVARAKQAGPVALSPKGDQLAIASGDALFLLPIPPVN